VLRLPRLALEAAGAETILVTYPPKHQPEKQWRDAIIRSVNAQVATAVAGPADRVTFVAKSLGTAALAGLDPDQVGSARTEAIWITPLFREAAVTSGAIALAWRSLLVAGEADTYTILLSTKRFGAPSAPTHSCSLAPTTSSRCLETPWPPSTGSVALSKRSSGSPSPLDRGPVQPGSHRLGFWRGCSA
jgi:hypothetical protein